MQNAEQKLLMGRTLEQLHQLAQTLPTDMHNPDDLKAAFSTCGFELMDALDNDRIHFDNDHDKAMLMGLLVVVTDYVMDGNLKRAFKKAAVN